MEIRETKQFSLWLTNLKDSRARAKILVRVERITSGNYGDHKSVGEGVWELRIDFGPGFRVYYGFLGKEVVLLLAGGDKDSQQSDILKAKEILNSIKHSGK